MLDRVRLKASCVSIPSSRVGTCPARSEASPNGSSFHPLKSGRDPIARIAVYVRGASFHPLKSGRDQPPLHQHCSFCVCFHPLKSGRDRQGEQQAPVAYESFHPLKSGRDLPCRLTSVAFRLFPSPQVGSGRSPSLATCARRLGFPSPQVGSGRKALWRSSSCLICFHPLKSGRDK